MAQRAKITRTKTTTRKKKTGGGSGYAVCRNCGGDGRVKVRKKG